MSTTTKTWFRLDLYRSGKKGVKTQSWYPSKNSAIRAKNALNTFKYAERVNKTEAGDVMYIHTIKCGGLIAQGPFRDNECNFPQP